MGQMKRGFCVFDVVVGKIAYQSSCKRGKVRKLRAFILSKDLADFLTRMGNFLPDDFRMFPVDPFSDGEMTIQAGDFQGGIVAQKGVAAPGLVIFRTFQHKAVMAGSAECPHDFNGGEAVCHDFPADRNPSVIAGCIDCFDFL